MCWEVIDRGVQADPQLNLGIGINDIGHGVTIEQLSNYEEILGRLRSDTRAAIVVRTFRISRALPNPASVQSEYHQQIVAFNQKLQEIAWRHDVSVFDIYAVTHEQLSSHPEFFSEDGFHPSDKGYQFWADEMWPIIALTIGAS